jgi:hypothetical protein
VLAPASAVAPESNPDDPDDPDEAPELVAVPELLVPDPEEDPDPASGLEPAVPPDEEQAPWASKIASETATAWRTRIFR